MFVWAGEKILNTDTIVEIRVTPAREERVLHPDELADYDYPEGGVLSGRELRLDVVTTATTSSFDDGGDYPEFKHTDFHPHTITLYGDDADEFLAALTVYGPLGPAKHPAVS